MIRAVEVPDLRIAFMKQWLPGGVFWNGTYERGFTSRSDATSNDAINSCTFAGEAVRQAELFWVGPEFVPLLVHAARSLPSDFDSAKFTMAAPCGLLFFAQQIKGFTPDYIDEKLPVDAVALSWGTTTITDDAHVEVGTGVSAMAYFRFKGQWLDLRGSTWVHGDGIDATRDERMQHREDGPDALERCRLDKRLIAAFSLLIAQRIAAVTTERMPRAVERRSAREDLPSAVRIVRLRQVIHGAHDSDGEGGHVDYSHRWIVSGHWRNHAMGKGQRDRTLIWIAPHVKGPDDKPLVVKDIVKALVR